MVVFCANEYNNEGPKASHQLPLAPPSFLTLRAGDSQVRVEQVLTTVPGSQAPSALLTFRLTALLSFYLDTVGPRL
jgi:hypothetical protein